eukprot:1390424-Rhodomonas_salina.3
MVPTAAVCSSCLRLDSSPRPPHVSHCVRPDAIARLSRVMSLRRAQSGGGGREASHAILI